MPCFACCGFCALPPVPATRAAKNGAIGLASCAAGRVSETPPVTLCRQAWSSPAGWVSQREWHPRAGVQGEALAPCSTITAMWCMTALSVACQSSESALRHGDVAQDFRQWNLLQTPLPAASWCLCSRGTPDVWCSRVDLLHTTAACCSVLLHACDVCKRAAQAPAADPHSLLLHAASAYMLTAAALAPAADPDSTLHGSSAHAMTSAGLTPAADPHSLPLMLQMLMP